MCDPSHIQLAAAGTGFSFDAHSGRSRRLGRPMRSQPDWLRCQTIAVIITESKNSPEPLGPGELLFFVSNQ
jgi:hypothetical protein